MNWNCPHCRTGLQAADNQIATQWRFSLCPRCLRFGLIRSSTATAVKVDVAPPGESFIRAVATSSAPVVIPAKGSRAAAAPIQVQLKPKTEKPVKLPEPLPEIPVKRGSIFPRLVLFSCFLILAWNGYRYAEITQSSNNYRAEISDRLTSQAMAPERIDLGSWVQARGEGFQIHNGAGRQFPVIGAMDPKEKYKIVAIEEDWFQIQTGAPTASWVSRDEISPAN